MGNTRVPCIRRVPSVNLDPGSGVPGVAGWLEVRACATVAGERRAPDAGDDELLPVDLDECTYSGRAAIALDHPVAVGWQVEDVSGRVRLGSVVAVR